MKADCLCISGVDTDAGKTVVVSALARAALARGRRVLLLKPVQTGATQNAQGAADAPDIAVYRAAAPGAQSRAALVFEPACSPHLAARLAGKSLTARSLADSVLALARQWLAEPLAPVNPQKPHENAPAPLVLVEGAGGLLAPLSETESMRDLFLALGWPVLLAAANRLGAVNHILLGLEGIRAAGLNCPGFILSNTRPHADDCERMIRLDNPLIAARLGGSRCLAEIPYLPFLSTGAEEPVAKREAAWDEAAGALAPVLPLVLETAAFDLSVQGAARPGEGVALLAFDREHVWHPYTSAVDPIRVWEAASTHGSTIRLKDGRELVDGMASWWCAVHGYRHPALMRALEDQARAMPHVMFGGLTHAPAVEVAQRLLRMAPDGLEHVFFADSGSVSVEAALKMALQYARATGKKASRLLTVRGGYHGDTMGAMSVCDPENGMHGLFAGYLPQQLFAPRPECRFDAPYDPASERAFTALLEAHKDEVAAVVLEPIVQGAGGMWFYHPGFLRAVRRACDACGCLLILDEIATGFGRTGEMFACAHAGVRPDIMCLGKALTGGVMTLAATLATKEVAEGISRGGGVFMHGPTFMANPLACAVAGASLELLETGAWKRDVARIESALRAGLEPCAAHDGVADVRVLGAIGVVEMERPVNMRALQAFFVERGVWIRPFGRLVYVMPPYIITDGEIERLCAAIGEAVRSGVWR